MTADDRGRERHYRLDRDRSGRDRRLARGAGATPPVRRVGPRRPRPRGPPHRPATGRRQPDQPDTVPGGHRMTTRISPAPPDAARSARRRLPRLRAHLPRTDRGRVGGVTDPERMERWIGTWTGDPSSGQVVFRMTAEGDDVAEETYLSTTCDPPRRLVIRGRDADPFSHDGSAPGQWELDLRRGRRRHDAAFAQVRARRDSRAMVASVGPGWDYYLDRMVARRDRRRPRRRSTSTTTTRRSRTTTGNSSADGSRRGRLVRSRPVGEHGAHATTATRDARRDGRSAGGGELGVLRARR